MTQGKQFGQNVRESRPQNKSCASGIKLITTGMLAQRSHYIDLKNGVTYVNIKSYLWLIKPHQKKTVIFRAVLCYSSAL